MLKLTLNGQVEYLSESDSDDALRRYWEAKSAGDLTAQLVRVEDSPPAPPPPPPSDVRALIPEVLPPVPAGVVSKQAQGRISEQERWLSASGFSVPPPIYAPGTRVNALGEENFRLERRRIEEMPYFDDAADSIIDSIRKEEREDHKVRLKDLALSPRGSLFVGNSDEFGLEVNAFNQLAASAGFGGGSRYLKDLCSAELRAANVNWQLAHRPSRTVVLRTRLGAGGHRHVFAVVTPTYAPVDTDQVLSVIRPALADAHTELVYDGDGVKASALFMPDEVIDLAAGDIFKVGIRLDTNDIGKGRIAITAVVYRNLCLNLIIIGEGRQQTVSQVHRGDTERIVTSIHEGVSVAREKVGDFLAAWGHARTLKLDPIETFEEWVTTKRIEVPGERDKDQLVHVFLTAWAKEPGHTLADAVNAVTRAAHEHPTWSLNIREALERRAAELVYVRA